MIKINSTKIKQCTKCKIYKPLTDFFNDKYAKSGKTSQCKTCRIAYDKEYKSNNKEKQKIQDKKYYENNKKHIKEREKKRYYENKEQKLEYNKQYRLKNKEKLKKQKQEYVLNNKEKIKARLIKNYRRNWSTRTINNHRKNGCIVNVDVDCVETMANDMDYCPICGCKLDWEYGTKPNSYSPSLDRIDNEQELNENNIWIICHKCNATKQDRTMKEFIKYCEHVVNKFK